MTWATSNSILSKEQIILFSGKMQFKCFHLTTSVNHIEIRYTSHKSKIIVSEFSGRVSQEVCMLPIIIQLAYVMKIFKIIAFMVCCHR